MRGIEALRQFLDPVEKERLRAIDNNDADALLRLAKRPWKKSEFSKEAGIILAGTKILNDKLNAGIFPGWRFDEAFCLTTGFFVEALEDIPLTQPAPFENAFGESSAVLDQYILKVITDIKQGTYAANRNFVGSTIHDLKNLIKSKSKEGFNKFGPTLKTAENTLNSFEIIEGYLLLKHGVRFSGGSADNFSLTENNNPCRLRKTQFPKDLDPFVRPLPITSRLTISDKIANELKTIYLREPIFPMAYALDAARLYRHDLFLTATALFHLKEGARLQLSRTKDDLKNNHFWCFDLQLNGLEIVADGLLEAVDLQTEGISGFSDKIDEMVGHLRELAELLNHNYQINQYPIPFSENCLKKIIALQLFVQNCPELVNYPRLKNINDNLNITLAIVAQSRTDVAKIKATLVQSMSLSVTKKAISLSVTKKDHEFKPGMVIESTDGKKWVIQEVREGGQAFVLIVKNPDIGRTEVLRIYKDPVNNQGIIESAKLLIKMREGLPQKLRSHLPEIYGTLEDTQARRFLRMEFVNGETTEELAKRQAGRCLTADQVIQILKLAVPVLKHLHSKDPDGPYVLRDIKPSNIMVKLDQMGSVVDFWFPDWDVALKIQHDKNGQPLEYTDENLAFGSWPYAAPEQIYVEQTGCFMVWPATDIYALGITINQWLTGIEPKDKNYHGAFAQRFPELHELVRLKELDKEWLDLVEGCTHLNTAAQNPNLPYRWSITDVKNWLQKYFPSK